MYVNRTQRTEQLDSQFRVLVSRSRNVTVSLKCNFLGRVIAADLCKAEQNLSIVFDFALHQSEDGQSIATVGVNEVRFATTADFHANNIFFGDDGFPRPIY